MAILCVYCRKTSAEQLNLETRDLFQKNPAWDQAGLYFYRNYLYLLDMIYKNYKIQILQST